IPFGGAGPLHGCRLSELLDIPAVIVPPRPGVLSTWGLLDTDIRATFVRTVGISARRAAAADPSSLEAAWADLTAQAQAWLGAEQIPSDRRRFERSADLRYEHQSFELTCPVADGPLSRARLDELIATFHAEHRRLYTYDLPHAQVELVNLRVTGVGILPKRVAATATSSSSADARDAIAGDRRVYFRGSGAATVPTYLRARLAPGMTFAGPAIVDQDDTTVLITPGFRARVDHAHNIILERPHA
ncbi:MAG: hydantoinase/oxoprolinase family protein, partial [Actinomycetota bacterium]|nr:hydantoinase/oxoprolinase family protein [Actinomycetota bacterium]